MLGRVVWLVSIVVVVGCNKAPPAGVATSTQKVSAKSEAAAQLDAIGRNAIGVHAATGKFPAGTAHTAPTTTSCCGYPGQRCPVAAASWQDPVWKELGMSIEEPTQFRYDYTGATDGLVFTARATGDLDCDGIEVVYTLAGVSPNNVPQMHLTEPRPDAD